MRIMKTATLEAKGMLKGPKAQYKKERARRIRQAAKKNPESFPNRIGNAFGVGGFGS